MQIRDKLIRIGDLMLQSGIQFGTSGVRGLAVDMTDEICYVYTTGFIQYLQEIGQLKPGGRIAIGGDLRESTPRIMKAVARAVSDMDYIVEYCGLLPTPAIAYYGFTKGLPTVMVTGSHIPEDRNGIKYIRPDGEILKDDEAGIRRQVVRIPSGLFDKGGMLSHDITMPPQDDEAAELYIRRYTEGFRGSSLRGLRIGVYQHSAVGRDIIARILISLGAEVVPLGRSESFIPVDTEAIRDEDTRLAREWTEQYRLDALVSTDGDGDRPLIGDEHGKWMRGDLIGLLCSAYLGADVVVTPLSSNTAVERCGLFKRVYRTRIGSPYVIEGMNKALKMGGERVVGYEANGGFLTASETLGLKPLPTRDAMLPIVCIMNMCIEKGKGMSQIVAGLPQRFTASGRIKDYPAEKSMERLRKIEQGGIESVDGLFKRYMGRASFIDTTDGLRIYFEGGEIIHLRPSGNAPEFRCYTEADTEKRALQIKEITLEIMERWRYMDSTPS